MSEKSDALKAALANYRPAPDAAIEAFIALIDERIALAKKARKPSKPQQEIDGFADWYATYPRKAARKAAARAYANARKLVTLERLLSEAQRYAAQVKTSDPKFILKPAKWLNDGCWEDEYPSPVQPAERQSKILRVMED